MVLQVLAQAEAMCDDSAGVVAALARLQRVQPLPSERLREVGAALHVDDRVDFRELTAQAEQQAGGTGQGR